jgi:hypothetical protein
MRARFRAFLLSTVMLFAGSSYASAAFDSDYLPDLATPAVAVEIFGTMPAASTGEIIVSVAVDGGGGVNAEMTADAASADLAIPLPEDVSALVASDIGSLSQPADASPVAVEEVAKASTLDTVEETGSLAVVVAPEHEAAGIGDMSSTPVE